VHNSWGSGAAMPTAVYVPATAVLNGQVYVIGGSTTAPVADVQIYNPVTNTWSAGTPLPVATTTASAATVNGVLYVLGGSTSTSFTNAVWAYSPTTKKWSSKAAAPTARNGTVAVVEKNIIYVMGGNISSGGEFVSTVESYNPAANTWKTESSMLGTKDTAAAGLIGSTIVVADGSNQPGSVTGDTEGYNDTTNAWSSLTADPTPRTGPCNGVINGLLYDAAGYNNSTATTINESFSLSANKWTTTLAPMPAGTLFGGSAVVSGQLYCLGGEAEINNNPIHTVQIYQP
jgi:N-acetylneuraminic acid mutarotase